MELKEKVSNDSGTNGILLFLLLDGKLFCSQYHTVGAEAARFQLQFLDLGRIKGGEGRQVHGCLLRLVNLGLNLAR